MFATLDVEPVVELIDLKLAFEHSTLLLSLSNIVTVWSPNVIDSICPSSTALSESDVVRKYSVRAPAAMLQLSNTAAAMALIEIDLCNMI
jgi:hypothetical protein